MTNPTEKQESDFYSERILTSDLSKILAEAERDDPSRRILEDLERRKTEETSLVKYNKEEEKRVSNYDALRETIYRIGKKVLMIPIGMHAIPTMARKDDDEVFNKYTTGVVLSSIISSMVVTGVYITLGGILEEKGVNLSPAILLIPWVTNASSGVYEYFRRVKKEIEEKANKK